MTMIDKVARAMHASAGIMLPWDALKDSDRQHLLTHAGAAIEAMREPTEEMIKAGRGDADEEWITDGDLIETHQSMIDAALAEKS